MIQASEAGSRAGSNRELLPVASPPDVGIAGLWKQFLPLSVSDVTMMLTDPLITTTLAHLPQARLNLAAIGVTKSLGNFFESPVLMMLHASNALAGSRSSRRALGRLMLILVGVLALLVALIGVPAVFFGPVAGVLGLDTALAPTVHGLLILFVLWPVAIGWRRYFQGLLIHGGHSASVGRAGLSRLVFVAIVLATGFSRGLPGAWLAGLAMVGGVVVEALAVTWAAMKHQVLARPIPETSKKLPLDLKGVWRFYWPLGGSMIAVWGGRVLLIALIARATDACTALALWPAAWGLVLLLANATRMVQQVVIRNRGRVPDLVLVRFVTSVGIVFSSLLLGLATTLPGQCLVCCFIADDPVLLPGILEILLLASVLPFLVSVQNGLQGFLIHEGRTARLSTGVCLGAIVLLAVAGTGILGGMGGAKAASIAMIVSLIVENLWLARGLDPSPEGASALQGQPAVSRP